MQTNKNAKVTDGISVVEVDSSYQVGDYLISILEQEGRKTFISVFKDGNLLTTFDGWSEAVEIAHSVTVLLEQLARGCEMCNAYQNEKVNEFCPKHQ